jgi:WD40 repeat protein/tRNA A-37 threonylcarbamoyl transferase component Bud32
MPDSPNHNDESKSQFDQVLAEYLRRIDAGEDIGHEQFIAEHPDVADSLREYFETADQLDQLAGAGSAETLAPGSPTRQPSSLPVVRYFGDYELLEEVARGGMGVVYKARQAKLNRVVAVKMILSGRLASESDVKRFYSEAEAAANLEHPNIVPIFEVGEHDGQHYFSMGFIEGESLASKIADSPLAGEEAATIVEQVARAVEYAHERGVLHRDLKPANVLLDHDSRPHITDFGLAKRVESDSDLTRTGQILGTPSFMPPEQAAGKFDVVGHASDVYSLGAILYALLVGRPPFQSANVMDTLKQVVEREPVSPRQLNPAISRDLETICLKCLEKSVARRYSSAGELADELRRFLAGEPIRARRVSRATRCWKWCRRNPVVAALTIACCLAVIAGSIGVTTQWLRATKEAGEKSRALTLERAARTNAEKQTRRAEDAELDARHHLYAAHMKLAQTAWRDDNLRAARSLLRRYLPENGNAADLRGFEWHYLWRLCHRELLTIDSEQLSTYDIAFTPNGERILSAGRDWGPKGMVKVWDARNGAELLELRGHEHPVKSVEVSPDGRLIASLGVSSKLIEFVVWDVENGQQLANVSGQASKDARPDLAKPCISFSSDSQHVATSDGGSTISLRDAHTGKETLVYTGHTKPQDLKNGQQTMPMIRSVVFSRDGRHVASSAGMRSVKVWDRATGKDVLSLDNDNETAGAYGVNNLAFGPSTHLLVGVGGSGVTLWGLPTGERLYNDFRVKQNFDNISTSAIHPLRTLIAFSTSNAVEVWDYSHEEHLATLKGHEEPVVSMAFSPNGRRLASCDRRGVIKLWDFRRDDPAPRRFRAPGTIAGFPSHGNTFAVQGEKVVSDDERMQVRDPDGSPPGGVFDTRTGQRLLTLEQSEGAEIATVSGDGKSIAGRWRDGEVAVWNAENGEKQFSLHLETTTNATNTTAPTWFPRLALSFDGNLLATNGCLVVPNDNRRQVKRWFELWDLQARRKMRTFSPVVDAFSLSSDGRLLAWRDSLSPREQIISVWDISKRTQRCEIPTPRLTREVAFSPDARWLASVTGDAVRVLDVSTEVEVAELHGHQQLIQSLAFSPDGARLATGSFDEVKLWDTHTWEEVFSSKGLFRIGAGRIAFSNDGRYMGIAFNRSGRHQYERGQAVCILDAREPSQKIVAEQEACRLVETLFEEGMLKEDVVDLLRDYRTISDPVRDLALGFTQQYHDDPKRPSVRGAVLTHTTPQSRAQNLRRLRYLEFRDDPRFSSSTASVLFRLGRYQDALQILEKRAPEFSTERDSAGSLRAIILHKLGRTDEAISALERFEESLAAWENPWIMRLLFLEARSLIGETKARSGEEQ